jgi:hypothetical protein
MKVVVEGTRLVSILGAVSVDKEIEVLELVFRPDGLYAKNVNEAKHVLSYCVFKPEFFLEYDVPEAQSIVLDVASVLKPLKIHKAKKFGLTVTDDEIRFKTDRGDEIWATKMYLENRADEIELVAAPFGRIVGMEGLDISEYCYAEVTLPKTQRGLLVNPLGEDTVALIVDGGKLKVEQVTKGTQGIRSVLADNVVNAKPMRVLVSTTYLRKAFGSIISTKAILALAQGKPIVVSERTTDYEININIAPKYEIEEVTEEESYEEEVEVDVGE